MKYKIQLKDKDNNVLVSHDADQSFVNDFINPTFHFDEVEGYTDFTLWDEIKFWGAVAIIFLVVITLIGEVTGLIDGFINWLGA